MPGALGAGIVYLMTAGQMPAALGAAALVMCSVANPLTLVVALFSVLSWYDVGTLQSVGSEQGLNAVDLLFLSGCAVLVLRVLFRRKVAAEMIRALGDGVAVLLLIVAGLATLSLVLGVWRGFPLRSALRDYRFFMYTPVFYLLVRTGSLKMRDIALVAGALTVVIAVQTVLVMTGGLILSSTATTPTGMPIFQRYGLETGVRTELHWLPIAWSFPFMIAVALLLIAQPAMFRLARLVLYAITMASLTILMLTYSRGLMLATAIGLGTVFVFNPYRMRRKRLRFFLLIAIGIGAAVWTGELLLRSSGSEGLVASLWTRFSPGSLAEGDRTPAAMYALSEALERPLLGLGLGSPYEEIVHEGKLIHTGGGESGWLWVATRIGFPGLFILLTAMYLTWRRSLQAFRPLSLQGRIPVGLTVGLLGCFAAMLTFITATTMLLYWGSSPFVGIWLGLLAQVHYLARATARATLLQPNAVLNRSRYQGPSRRSHRPLQAGT
jgi:hypothetical protein